MEPNFSLLKARRGRRMRQSDLAEAARVSVCTINRIERGGYHRAGPDPDTCIRLAEALGEAPEALFPALRPCPVSVATGPEVQS